MALWTCQDCGAAYSVGAPLCPQCGSNDYEEGADPMAKVTVHGGPSNASAEPDDNWQAAGEPDPDLAEPAAVEPDADPEPAGAADDTSTTVSKRAKK